MILTVGTDDGLREQVSASLRDTQWATSVSSAPSVGEAETILRGSTPPRVVVVGASIGVDGAGDVAALASTLRHPPLVLLVGRPSTELLRQAMRAGIRDVLPVGFTAEDLVASLREAGVTGGGPDPRPGMTVAVFSTKGGVGTSVVASNLAVLLAERTGAATTLVDLDLASADQAIMHGMTPRWTIQDLADGSVALDEESLEQVLGRVEGSASRLLPGPVDPALAEKITASDVGTIIASVRAQSPIAVLDLASSFDDRTLMALDAADVTVVVSSLDVAALRALSVSLQTLERLGQEPSRILLALVRADSKSGLVVTDIERAIDRTIDVQVPSTRAVPRSVNEGVPLAVSSRRSAVIQALDELVELLAIRLPASMTVEQPTSARGGSGLFRFGRSRTDQSAVVETAGDHVGRPPSSGPAPPPDGGDGRVSDGPRDEATEDDNVRPIRVRRSEQGTRRVRRAGEVAAPAGLDTDDDQGGGVGEDPVDGTDEAPIYAVPLLEDLPPPTVATDDEDDQPRRRRRR